MDISSSSLINVTKLVKTKKDVNIELIRIVAMLAVVGLHYFCHGGGTVWPEFGSVEYIIYWAIEGYLFICVNLFVLITGYCLISVKFKVSRLMKLWIQVVSYSILCTVACKIAGAEIEFKQILKSVMPLTSESYWFATAYAVLLCISPVLNAAISAMNKFQHLMVIVGLTIVFSIMPTFLVWERDLLTTGMDYEWFMVLYIFSAYIRKYGIPLSNRHAIMGYLLCSGLTGFLRYPLGLISHKLIGSYILSGLFFRYNSATVLAASVFMFWYLMNIKIKKEWLRNVILQIAPLTFAVYLIHDNEFVRNILWNALPIRRLYDIGVGAYLTGLLIFVPAIFACCCLIEKIRLAFMTRTKYADLLKNIDLFSDRIQGLIYDRLRTTREE